MPLRRSLLLPLLVLIAALLASGCGASESEGGGGGGGGGGSDGAVSKTLRLAFFADVATVDPDVFYDIEGNALTLSVYDGLLRYKPNSTELEGALAESWEVAPDGRRYTFKLREAKFSDGTPVTSEAVERSFKRRTKVDQGPAYMLADVMRYSTLDDRTLELTLKRPNASFLELLASVWGPKVINPKALTDHASDQAQKYLKTNMAGTGPFMLERFKAGTGYTLTRNPNYWGTKPFFDSVQIAVTPDVSQQILKTQRGDLDAILHGLPLSSLNAVKASRNLMVKTFDSLGTSTLNFNTERPALSDLAVRQAVLGALDVPNLVKAVWGDTATVFTDAYPRPLLPEGSAPLGYAAGAAGGGAGIPKGLSLDVVYTPDSSGVQRRLADLIQQKLTQAGVKVNSRQVELATVFGYRDDVKDAADIYLSTPTPDAAHPDAWGRIVWYTEGGLNFFNYSNKRVDAALDAGVAEQDDSKAAAHYAEAGKLAVADRAVNPLAQVKDVMVLNANLTGVEHSPAYPWTLDLGALGRK